MQADVNKSFNFILPRSNMGTAKILHTLVNSNSRASNPEHASDPHLAHLAAAWGAEGKSFAVFHPRLGQRPGNHCALAQVRSDKPASPSNKKPLAHKYMKSLPFKIGSDGPLNHNNML